MTTEAEGPDALEQYAIGVSFGNSTSSIAHVSGDGKVEVIANQEGDRQIPSILSYVEGEEYHGSQAKHQLIRNSKNTVAYFRDFVGKTFKSIDPTPCHASAHPIGNESTIAFSIQDAPDAPAHEVSVSEITTRHFRRLKASASDFIGKTVTSAVISIPTDNTDDQISALNKAAEDAGIQVLQFIPEPVAAVLAYDSRSRDTSPDKIVLVTDFGGTRSDVTLLASRDGMYSILATAHDYDLGGARLDAVLVDYIAKEFIKKHKTDPRSESRSLANLKQNAEAVKKTLSQSASATFYAESLADGIDFSLTINRTRYEMLAANVFRNFTRLVEEVIRKADLDVLDVDEVIMSGGTSHTPRIASNLQSLFPESTSVLSPSTSSTALNPSELSARGAALQASLIQEFDKEDIDQSTHEMVTITPHLHDAIGIQIQPSQTDPQAENDTASSQFLLVIPTDSAVPVRRTKTITTPTAGDLIVTVCEAERETKITKPEPTVKVNGNRSVDDDESVPDPSSDEDEDEDEDEPEELRERIWRVKRSLAEFSLLNLHKGAQVEVTVNVGSDLAVDLSAREVGAKKGGTGVRGHLSKPELTLNGTA